MGIKYSFLIIMRHHILLARKGEEKNLLIQMSDGLRHSSSTIQTDFATSRYIQGCIQKFPDWQPGARTANGTALCH